MAEKHTLPDDTQGTSQLSKVGSSKAHVRPRVELLAIHANLVVGTTITVFDTKRGQIIYRHEEQGEQKKEQGKQEMEEQEEQKEQGEQEMEEQAEQKGEQGEQEMEKGQREQMEEQGKKEMEEQGEQKEEQGEQEMEEQAEQREEQGEQVMEKGQRKQEMRKLVLTGPYTGIGAYGCFAIRIDIPAADAAADSSSIGAAPGTINWKWNFDETKYASQVDNFDKPSEDYIITQDDGKEVPIAKVYYVVMSNALDATVQVKLLLKDGEDSCGVHGTITAFIGKFKDRGSELFRREVGKGQHFSPKCSRFLQLARSVVMVPCGEALRLKVDLHIENSSKDQIETDFIFDNGTPSQIFEVDGNQIEVDVSWYPEDTTSRSVPPSRQKKIKMTQRQPDISYEVGDDGEGFRTFINELRCKVADHPSREDVLEYYPEPAELGTTRDEHPVLATTVSWLHIKLKVVIGKKQRSITLVMRDDNLYVMGFMNKDGVCYELGDQAKARSRPVLPSQYKSEHLDWGNSYKSILQCRNTEEVVKILDSLSLGKAFTVEAVTMLSRFPHHRVAGDIISPRQALVGVMVMVCESAKLNRLRDAFVRGWNTGTLFTKEELLMSYILKWDLMSSTLLRWKDHMYCTWIDYPELERIGIQSPQDALDVIHLVRNIRIHGRPEEYAVGDSLSFAYPEMVKVSFQEMFKKMSIATVQVNLRRLRNGHMNSVYGKIAALISDEHRQSIYFRVGTLLFARTEKMGYRPRSDSEVPLPLARSAVAVPSGLVLHIEVDLYIKIPHNNGEMIKPLKVTFHCDKGNLSQTRTPKGTGVHVEVNSTWPDQNMDKQYIPAQLCQPVEVLESMSGNPTIVYTIGDVMSFTEFIISLRRILADHPDREDILDGHDLLNLSASREHPLLARQHVEPARWIHVKLQMVDDDETSSVTLVMRDDNLYVLGFFNQSGVLHKLVDIGKDSINMIPEGYHRPTKYLNWGVSYQSLLEVETRDEIARELRKANLGSAFAMDAVCVLSRYPNVAASIAMEARVALAGLFVMVCDSAKMNPVLDTIARGWDTGAEFTPELMGCIWNWGHMSSVLLRWKRGNYAEQNCYSELRDIHLVLNRGIFSSKIDDGKKGPGFSKIEMAAPGQSHTPEQTTSKETGGQEYQEPSRPPQEEYGVGDLASHAYPEMLKASFPEMFKEMSIATVQVNLSRQRKEGLMTYSVYGKIAAHISDEHRHSVYFRAGSMLFTSTRGVELTCSKSSVVEVPLARSVVAVPSGWILHIEVDLYIKIPHNNSEMIKRLKVTFHYLFDKGNLSDSQTQIPKGSGVQVQVEVKQITWTDQNKEEQYFPAQLSRPVEVLKTTSGHPTVVYTIGDDVMSFTEFIMALRRILADHPDREDIMDGHELLNIASTREHPLLPKQHPQPARWLHVKLQAEVEGEGTWSTTLVMRGDNLHVLGFFNDGGVLHKLVGNKETEYMVPGENRHRVEKLPWGVSYSELLQEKLMGEKLDSLFARNAVRVLSRYTNQSADITLMPRVALAGLIVMVCGSARMNTVQYAIAGGWNSGGVEITKHLMADCLFNYGKMSRSLREWKRRNYEEPHCYEELRSIYLVLNDGDGGRRRGRTWEASSAGSSGGGRASWPGESGSASGDGSDASQPSEATGVY